MGVNWCGIIVKTDDLAAAKADDHRAIALPNGFVRVKYESIDWTRPGSTLPWSKKFGEAWMLCAASASDVFAYEHSKDGVLLRALGFDGSEGWSVVEGEREEWEWFEGEPTVGETEPFADCDGVLGLAKRIGTELVR